jgi:peptide/nickel transport system permease protein
MNSLRRRWVRDRPAVVATAGLLLIALAAGSAQLWAAALGSAPEVPNLALRYCAPSSTHLLGCDGLGQDVFLRLLYGARVSLAVGVCAAAIQVLIGVSVGALAGFRGGFVDVALMRVLDALLSLPVLPVLLVASAMKLSAGGSAGGMWPLILILGAFGWMPIARVTRAEVMRSLSLDFVTASVALGAPSHRTLWSHVLPQVTAPVMVLATLDIGRNILLESALSYLGLGIHPPAASWGNMLTHAESELLSRPALAFWPGLCIVATVLCLNSAGEGLRRALDPRAPLS